MEVGSIGAAGNVATGEATICGSCAAVLSHLSRVTGDAATGYTWVCEYCTAENSDLMLSPEELPEALAP